MNGQTDLFRKLLQQLGPADLAVLGDPREDANDPASDVDVIGTRAVLQKIKSLVRAGQLRAVQLLQHETTCFYWVIHQPDERGRPRFLPLDFALEYRQNGKLFYRAEDLLPHRVQQSQGSSLPPRLQFGYYIVKKIGKGNLETRHAEFLSGLYRRDPQGCERELARFFPDAERRTILEAAHTSDWSAVRSLLPRLQRVMKPSRRGGDWIPEIIRRARRVLQPSGLVVALLGPDGSGKSTLAGRITRDLSPAFRHTRIVHLRPSLRARTANGPVTDPHGLPARGIPASILKLAYWWGETLLGWLATIQPAKIRSTLVVFDRYYHDLLADPQRYRFGGPVWLARWVGYWIPQPDIFLLLDLPAEAAHARKAEIPLEEARQLRQRYRNLERRLPNAHLVDASLPIEEVATTVENIILDRLAQRLRKRLDL